MNEQIEEPKVQTDQELKVEEIKNSIPVMLMRCVFKIYRFYFVSLAFYFMPLGALLLAFMVNRPKKEWTAYLFNHDNKISSN